MILDKQNLEGIAKGEKKIFSHFCKNKKVEIQEPTNSDNKILKNDISNIDMARYSVDILEVINTIRNNPNFLINYFDRYLNSNIQKQEESLFLYSQETEQKIKLMNNYYELIEKVKKDILNKINDIHDLNTLNYNESLEIFFDGQKFTSKKYTSKFDSTYDRETHIFEYNKNEEDNNIIDLDIGDKDLKSNSIKKIKIKQNIILDLNDDKIADLILQKRKEIKDKYPNNIFKLNVIKDKILCILIQILMDEIHQDIHSKKFIEILFDKQYQDFAISWTYEINRNFISIFCFA
jgi:hypothetical protein